MTSSMRASIAKLMTLSKQTIPHYYLSRRMDVTALMQYRQEMNATHEIKVSVNDLLMRACALALNLYPEFNGYYQDGRFEAIDSINLGVAIALEGGVIAPAVLECENLTIWQIAQKSKDLAARARLGTLKALEYTGATITLSNLGMYDIDTFMPIIIPPQVAILGIGSVMASSEFDDDIRISKKQISITLVADHRVSDGARGAQFLAEINQNLSDPEKIFGQEE